MFFVCDVVFGLLLQSYVLLPTLQNISLLFFRPPCLEASHTPPCGRLFLQEFSAILESGGPFFARFSSAFAGGRLANC